MSIITQILGLVIVFLTSGLILIFSLPRKKKPPMIFRSIPAVDYLKQALGLAIEQGTRIHISLGKTNLTDPSCASTLASLTSLEKIAESSISGDLSLVVTTGEGAINLLSRDSIQAACRIGKAPELFDPDSARLTGVTPFSYAVGSLPVIYSGVVTTNVLIGHFGSEVLLLTEASEKTDSQLFNASDSLQAQAVMFASTENTLLGEEIFALPAYLSENRVHQASLYAQDYLRLLLVFALIIGAILTFLGYL